MGTQDTDSEPSVVGSHEINRFFMDLRYHSRPQALQKIWILYLDQCVVSMMLKPPSHKWQKAASLAQRAVDMGRMVCPVSTSHHRESSAAAKTGRDIYALIQRLSRGWYFSDYDAIRLHQLLPSFGRFAKLHWWRDLTNTHPPLSVAPLWPLDPRRLSPSNAIPERAAALAQLPKKLTMLSGDRSDSFEYSLGEEMKLYAEKMQLDALFKTDLASLLSDPGAFHFPGYVYLVPMRTIAELENVPDARAFLWEFMTSAWYMIAPAVILERLIWASLRKRASSGRNWLKSDYEDVSFAAVVTTYVDVMVVEGGLADVLRSRNVDAETMYRPLQVLSARAVDDFNAFLERVVA